MRRNSFSGNSLYKYDLDAQQLSMEIKHKYEKYAIPEIAFSSESNDEIYTKDEIEAMYYIDRGMELPKELEDKLLNTLEIRQDRNKKIVENIQRAPESWIERILGKKLK